MRTNIKHRLGLPGDILLGCLILILAAFATIMLLSMFWGVLVTILEAIAPIGVWIILALILLWLFTSKS